MPHLSFIAYALSDKPFRKCLIVGYHDELHPLVILIKFWSLERISPEYRKTNNRNLIGAVPIYIYINEIYMLVILPANTAYNLFIASHRVPAVGKYISTLFSYGLLCILHLPLPVTAGQWSHVCTDGHLNSKWLLHRNTRKCVYNYLAIWEYFWRMHRGRYRLVGYMRTVLEYSNILHVINDSYMGYTL